MLDEQQDRIMPDDIEELKIEVKDHLEKDVEDQCAYCGQMFGPDEIVIVKEINGRKWRFCSEQCYQDFKDASNFKDEDLDSKDVVPPSSDELDEGEDIF
jgi:hypothetical protein